jgi:hypothetical protein
VKCGPKLLPFYIQYRFHLLQWRERRHWILKRLFSEKHRNWRPTRDTDQVRMKSLSKLIGDCYMRAYFTTDTDMNH